LTGHAGRIAPLHRKGTQRNAKRAAFFPLEGTLPVFVFDFVQKRRKIRINPCKLPGTAVKSYFKGLERWCA
jgi:hypothetical protein